MRGGIRSILPLPEWDARASDWPYVNLGFSTAPRLAADWKVSDTGREAKFYSLTRFGQKQLCVEKDSWARLTGAVQLIFDEGTSQ